MDTIAEQLRAKGVRPTPIRITVLHLLTQSPRAYTHADLERTFEHALDRVSLYSCLFTLLEAGLIQKLIDSKGACSYFYEAVQSAGNQPHFKCSQCETVVSLPELPEAYMNAVRTYRINTIQVLAEGTCDNCQPKSPAT